MSPRDAFNDTLIIRVAPRAINVTLAPVKSIRLNASVAIRRCGSGPRSRPTVTKDRMFRESVHECPAKPKCPRAEDPRYRISRSASRCLN